MNLIAIILTLIGGGIRETSQQNGGYINNPDGYVWEEAGAEICICGEIVPEAQKKGVYGCFVYDFRRFRNDREDREHEHVYCYKLKDKKTKQFYWYYFSQPCSKCQFSCEYERGIQNVSVAELERIRNIVNSRNATLANDKSIKSSNKSLIIQRQKR